MMEIRYVDDAVGLDALRDALNGVEQVGLDCEAAGYHRYSDRLCLVQLTSASRTYLVDCFAVEAGAALRTVLEEPGVEVVMHGADFDVRLLDRDLDIGVAGLFDTQIAASLLGERAVGLAALLESRLGIRLPKTHQRADWATRPLPAPMREYAAGDAAHLSALAEILRKELEQMGRMRWAEEEFRELESVRYVPPDDVDPVLGIRDARLLAPRELARLREALAWRDRIGRELDRALFRVAADAVLIEAARRNPETLAELRKLPRMGRSIVERWGPELLEQFRRITELPEDQLVGYPVRSSNGSGGRSSPEVEARMSRLKGVRNERAKELGIDRGTLLPNSVLLQIACAAPSRSEDVLAVQGVRRWQAELLADDLVASL